MEDRSELSQPAGIIWRQAAFTLRREENVREGLRYFRDFPERLNVRITEFDRVIIRMGNVMQKDVIDPRMQSLIRLKENLGEFHLRLLLGLEIDIQTGIESLLVSYARDEIFERIRSLIETGEWGYIRELRQPEVITSALLIEGYGQMLEQYLQIPGLNKTFVLAFEEILWVEFEEQELNILQDVIPWMIEERTSFEDTIRRELERLYLVINSSWMLRWTGTPLSVHVLRNEISTERILDFNFQAETFESMILKGERTSVLIRIKDVLEEKGLETIVGNILEYLENQCNSANATGDSRYTGNVFFIDISSPPGIERAHLYQMLKGQSVNSGYIDVSVYDRDQLDIAELVWISSSYES